MSVKERKEETERKHWDWLDLSSDSEDGHLGSFSDGRQAKESEKEDHDDQFDGTGWGDGYEERGDTVYDHPPANWLPPLIDYPNHHYRIGSALHLDYIGQHLGLGGPEENLLLEVCLIPLKRREMTQSRQQNILGCFADIIG
ncbi:hypothetical protein PGT21_022241 [Puccinia graminis f. sp. tritici]|uniref:Uncharacterized protein n=1 Tax=Puccinia graminis f. sp. tritici TaxID=56615 RepID=A0A5B0QV86_PUCGR|nr:hypothetical protein PGT21_022241 [Puccinia graminis f. sp. tritici]KAA1117176.1 hypothetical protein PGTUg99_036726 [Puccinia graminis f. sp. tritici]